MIISASQSWDGNIWLGRLFFVLSNFFFVKKLGKVLLQQPATPIVLKPELPTAQLSSNLLHFEEVSKKLQISGNSWARAENFNADVFWKVKRACEVKCVVFELQNAFNFENKQSKKNLSRLLLLKLPVFGRDLRFDILRSKPVFKMTPNYSSLRSWRRCWTKFQPLNLKLLSLGAQQKQAWKRAKVEAP